MSASLQDSESVWEKLTSPTSIGFLERATELTGLVHYTTFPTLKGIIENNELWFSPVASMNDVAEVSRGKELLKKFTSEGGQLANYLSSIKEFDSSLWKAFSEEYEKSSTDDLLNTFVSCWSSCNTVERTHDNLTMWRGYASDGNGVAIVLDPIQLDFGAVPSEIIIRPVYYETEDEFLLRARKRLEHFVFELKNLDESLIDNNHFQAARAFSELCFNLAITHKHKGFEAEKEWRFIWRRHRSSDFDLQNCVKPQVTDTGILEYLCLPLEKNSELGLDDFDLGKTIVEIMVGPTYYAHLKQKAVKTLLSKHSLDPQRIVVSSSEIPFRSYRF